MLYYIYRKKIIYLEISVEISVFGTIEHKKMFSPNHYVCMPCWRKDYLKDVLKIVYQLGLL